MSATARPAPAESAWVRVKWAEAGQVAAQLDELDLPEPEASLTPQDWWAARVAAGDTMPAIRFLAMALPRLEAIGWAAAALDAAPEVAGEAATRAAVRRWLEAPDDERRRAAWGAAQALDGGPARHLAAAVFFSGGSIAPGDCPEVPPPPNACAVAVAGSVIGAAWRSRDPGGAVAAALAAGARIAAGRDD